MRYKSCIWIESGISFDIDSYKVCCLYSSLGGGNTVVLSQYGGEPIDWDGFFYFKDKIRTLHKKGKINPKCVGCTNLIERNWSDNVLKISNINLDYWTKCNSSCSYCFTSKDKEYYNSYPNYNFLPILQDMIDRNIISPDGHISFGGGEVTLLDEFDVLLNKFIDLGFKQIKIHTSAIKYSDAIERGLESGCVELIVSVDSGSKEMHRQVKQVDSYDVVWANIAKYSSHQKGNSKVKTKYILIPGLNDSKSEIYLWLQKSKEAGVTHILQEIESEWFYSRREDVPDNVIEFFNYAKEKSFAFNLHYDVYERAEHMLKFYSKKKQNIFLWYVLKYSKSLINKLKNIKSKIFSFFNPL